jgi:uncharacterized protein
MPTMILKVTDLCNSNCSYCDVVSKRRNGEHMPLSVLERVYRRIDEYLGAREGERFHVIWHGGEPLLLPPEYYRSALELQRERCPRTQGRIVYGMQSNLTLLTEGHVNALRALGVSQIGTSYDPAPGIRGPGTPSDTAWYNRKFQQGDALLQRYGIRSGIIYVVTRKSLERPLDLFHLLTNLRPGGSITMNPVLLYDGRRPDLAIAPVEYADFLGAIFPYWWKHRNRYPDVDPFRSLLANIRDKAARLGCADSGRCSGDHVNVDPRGETSQCGRSSDWGLLPYGNLRERSLEAILSDPQRTVLSRRNAALRAGDCRGCRFWDLCHGGCPLDPYPEHADFHRCSEWGCARKLFVEKYFEPHTGLRHVPGESLAGA